MTDNFFFFFQISQSWQLILQHINSNHVAYSIEGKMLSYWTAGLSKHILVESFLFIFECELMGCINLNIQLSSQHYQNNISPADFFFFLKNLILIVEFISIYILVFIILYVFHEF